MVKINIRVDTGDDKVISQLESGNASLADLTIAERILRRYLVNVASLADKLLDRDTDNRRNENRSQGSLDDNELVT